MRRYLLYSFLALVALLGGAFWYAHKPYLSPAEFAPQGIVVFAGAPAAAPDLPETITVVTYNIGYASGKTNNLGVKMSRAEVETNLKAIAAGLKQLNPDVIGMQEVDFRSARTHDIDQFRYLADALQMPYGAYVMTWNLTYLPWPYWPPSRHYGHIVSGQAVLSRFPLSAQQATVLPKPATNPFWYNWFYLERVLQKLTLSWNGGKSSLWNVHLDAFSGKTRLLQAEILSKQIQADADPLKFAIGDFNSASLIKAGVTPNESDKDDIGESLALLEKETGMKKDPPDPSRLSQPSWDPIKKIDQLFASPDWELTESGVLAGVTGSDHLAVWGKYRRRR